MYRRFAISIATFLLIIAVSAVTILYARGYKIDPSQGGVVKTGFLSINSWPDGAIIELDGRITDVTNAVIQYLKPGTYRIKLTLEGYLPWEKEVTVKEELVTEIDAVLFPNSPSLGPLTFTGANRALLSPDGNRIVYAVTDGRNAGLWVLDLRIRPFRTNRPQLIVRDTFGRAFSRSIYSWSPKSDLVLVALQENDIPGEAARRTFLLSPDRLNENLLDVTYSIESTIAQWEEDTRIEEDVRRAQLADDVLEVLDRVATGGAVQADREKATGSAVMLEKNKRVRWSPNQTRFIYFPADDPETLHVYDVKRKVAYPLPGVPESTLWYPSSEPDSRHLVFERNGAIHIIEFDGSNDTVVFAGNFDPAVVFPWPEGGQLVIRTSFNVDGIQNLYALKLR